MSATAQHIYAVLAIAAVFSVRGALSRAVAAGNRIAKALERDNADRYDRTARRPGGDQGGGRPPLTPLDGGKR